MVSTDEDWPMFAHKCVCVFFYPSYSVWSELGAVMLQKRPRRLSPWKCGVQGSSKVWKMDDRPPDGCLRLYSSVSPA